MMGDIADMMLEGLLDEQTGEYIGDTNERLYGEAAPGFPVSYAATDGTTNCPICGKRVKSVGLLQHTEAKHGG